MHINKNNKFLKREWLQHGSLDSPGKYSWNNTDTAKQYRKHKKRCPDALKENGWLDVDIEYNINQYHFRDTWQTHSDFTPGQIMAVGCSVTAGIGVRGQDTWPAHLSQMTGLRAYNFGAPAGGLETLFRTMLAWIDDVQPKHVCILSPGINRRELNIHRGIKMLGPWSSNSKDIMPRGAIIDLLSDDECAMAGIRAVSAMSQLCQSVGAKLHYIYYSDAKDKLSSCLLARDLLHPGTDFLYDIACNFKDQINNDVVLDEYDVKRDTFQN